MTEIRYVHNEVVHNTKAAEEVLPLLFSKINPKHVIDVGCGTGSWLNVAKNLGAYRILGVDGIYVDKKLLCINNEDFLQQDLTKPLTLHQKYDLAICLEVAEHLPEDTSNNLVKILTDHSDVILFSAAIPGQGGQNHINEQWPLYWQKKFAKKRFVASDFLRDIFWDNNQVEWWYKQNMLIYFRKENNHFGFDETEKIQAKIHPELFRHKINHVEQLYDFINNKTIHPKFWQTLKNLVKSIFQCVKKNMVFL